MTQFTLGDFAQEDRVIIDACLDYVDAMEDGPQKGLATIGCRAIIQSMASRYYFAGKKFGWLRNPPRASEGPA